jgi:membrane-bound lytic murein transglycosylase C
LSRTGVRLAAKRLSKPKTVFFGAAILEQKILKFFAPANMPYQEIVLLRNKGYTMTMSAFTLRHLIAPCRRFAQALLALCRRRAHPIRAGLYAVIVLVLLAGFVPGRLGELRLPLHLSAPPWEEAGKWPPDPTAWTLRLSLSERPVLFRQASDVGDEDALLSFSADGVSILTAEGPRRVLPSLSGTAESDLFHLLARQSQGLPSGLSLAAADLGADRPMAPLCVPSLASGSGNGSGNENRSAAIRAAAWRRAWRAGDAAPYSATVDSYANKFGLDRRLIYAIMYTESGFNPTAISNRDAHGLMQVVPYSAGHEVHAYLHGVAATPDAATLLHPPTNIQYGVTYLHLLLERHMDGVTNPLSREYCAVSAYNIGPGAVLKVFGATRPQAFAAINALTPEGVYDALIARLPAAETRAFLRKVIMLKSGLALAETPASTP